MAIALRGTATTGSTTVTAPTGVSDSDLLILTAVSASGTTITVPSGWTTVRNVTVGGSFSTLRLVVAYLVWTAGTATSWTITGATYNACSAYSGCNPSAPLVVENYATGSGVSTIATPTVNNTQTGAWRVECWGANDTFSSSLSAWTTFSPADTKRAASNSTTFAIAITDSNATIATGNTSVTGTVPSSSSGNSMSAAWIGILAPITTIAATDTASGADSANVSAGTDTSTGTDLGSVTATTPLAADTGLGSDAATLTATTSGTDSSSGLDLAFAANIVSSSDTGGSADTAYLSVQVTGTDAATAIETTAAVTASVTASEGASGSETATVTATISVTDTGLGTESPLPDIDVTDVATAIDTAMVLLTVSGTDSAVGADLASVPIPAADTSHGLDTATVTAVIAVTDLGVGADYTHNYWYVSDFGTGTDQAATAPNAADTATGTENASVLALVTVLDTGFGFDLVPLGQPGVTLHGIRVVPVPAESRTVQVPWEPRIVRVPLETRAHQETR